MRSNAEWRQWGKTDPLFGVASWFGKTKDGPQPWKDDEFYPLGESDWADFAARWERYGVDRTCCVEIGCGAGRLTKPMAGYFGVVIATDVSEGMVDYARRHVPAGNVLFSVADGLRLAVADGAATAAFSTHVFQHFDSPQNAVSCLREIHRALAPGGTLMIHMMVYEWPAMARFFERVYRWRKIMGQARANWLRRTLRRGRWKPFMRIQHYEIAWVLRALKSIGFQDVEMTIAETRSTRDPHPFAFARKPAAPGPAA